MPLVFPQHLKGEFGSTKMIPISKCSYETTSHLFRAHKPGCIFLKLSNMSFLMLLFTTQLASLQKEHKMSRAKEVTWHREDIRIRTIGPNCSTSRVYLFVVGFAFIPRESLLGPHQILVSAVVSCREWPVKSQWSKRKWNGPDTGDCQKSRGCTSLHD